MDGGKRRRLGVKGCRVAKLKGAIFPKVLENYSIVYCNVIANRYTVYTIIYKNIRIHY
jgi:hypothetical protein